MSELEYYYRYKDGYEYFDSYDYKESLELEEFQVIKYTNKGVWINFPERNTWKLNKKIGKYEYEMGKKFILLKTYNGETNKRYAWNTKEEALISYKKRKEKQISILKGQLERAKNYLEIANETPYSL